MTSSTDNASIDCIKGTTPLQWLKASELQGATGAHSTQWQLRCINTVPTPDV